MSGVSGDQGVWDEYRALRSDYYKWLGVMLGGMLALFLFVAVTFSRGGFSPATATVVGIMAAIGVVAVYRYTWQWLLAWTWPCPACGGGFNLSLARGWPRNTCVWCGVRVGSPLPGSRDIPPN